MSYRIGKGSLYLGNVKWSTDNVNVVLFATALDDSEAKAQGKITRDNFMKSHLTKIKDNVIWYDPNTYVDVEGRIKSVDSVNYCYYEPDPDILDIHLCCFVTDYEYRSPNCTRLYLKLDTWQTYIYDTTLYQSYIERAIIPKANDSALYNTLPEPISATLENEYPLANIFQSSDWEPVWILHSASTYVESTAGKGEYKYSGIGADNTFGEYCWRINSVDEMASYIRKYGRMSPQEALDTGSSDYSNWIADLLTGQAIDNAIRIISTTSIAELQDHRNELIGLYAIPKWLSDSASDYQTLTNKRFHKKQTISLNSTRLANGYEPRNKKLLSSVCRGYIFANKNGLKIPLKPEIFTANSTEVTLTGIPTSISGFQYHFSNYADYQQSFGEIAYTSERRVGYDANTGLNKALNVIGAGTELVGSVGALAGSIATENPVGIVSGIGGTIGSGVRVIDSLGQKEEHFGNNGDLLRITGSGSGDFGNRAQLGLYEINPRLDQCQAIDNFFDMYGYAINRHWNIANYTNNRSEWNFVKTQNCDLRTYAPARYEEEIKQIFNNGVRIWHNYDHYAQYSLPNN